MSSGREGYPSFAAQIALGKVPGYVAYRKFGMNPAVNGSGNVEDMWPVGGVKTIPTSAAVAVCSSDSAEDDPDDGVDAGTGAHTIVVEGLDANYLNIEEEVTLDGTSNSSSTKSFLRVNRAYAKIVGTNGVNVGNITITVGGDTQAYIEAGEGQTHQLAFTVAADEYIVADTYLLGVGRMANGDAQLEFQIRLYNESSNNNYESWRSLADNYLFNGEIVVNETSVVVIPPKTDVRVQITSTAATQAFAEVGAFRVKANVVANL